MSKLIKLTLLILFINSAYASSANQDTKNKISEKKCTIKNRHHCKCVKEKKEKREKKDKQKSNIKRVS